MRMQALEAVIFVIIVIFWVIANLVRVLSDKGDKQKKAAQRNIQRGREFPSPRKQPPTRDSVEPPIRRTVAPPAPTPPRIISLVPPAVERDRSKRPKPTPPRKPRISPLDVLPAVMPVPEVGPPAGVTFWDQPAQAPTPAAPMPGAGSAPAGEGAATILDLFNTPDALTKAMLINVILTRPRHG
jgi:hypothetical protein